MTLEIVTPEACLYTGRAVWVSFPGSEGRFEVWPGHAPLIAALKGGEIRYKANGNDRKWIIAGGFAEIRDDRISACVEQEPPAGRNDEEKEDKKESGPAYRRAFSDKSEEEGRG